MLASSHCFVSVNLNDGREFKVEIKVIKSFTFLLELIKTALHHLDFLASSLVFFLNVS